MKPYYQQEGITIYHGDCREIMPTLEPADAVIADPPYGDTSLNWDQRVRGWQEVLARTIHANATIWCFGSFRFFWESANEFSAFDYIQEIVWEKHNGSGFINDRFKRCHELAVQFRLKGARWADCYKKPIHTPTATKRVVRRKKRPPHMGEIEGSTYVSVDGGPRLMRSVIPIRSCHGYAQHPTQKPTGIVHPLIEYSCPPGGLLWAPFMGSGTDLEVARQLGVRAIGIDDKEEYCEIAANRLSQPPIDFSVQSF